jgi:hypothetical protein
MTDALRYLCIARLDEMDRLLLWEGEDPGPARIVVDDNGFIVVFASEAQARDEAARWSISPEEASSYDFDTIETWCRSDVAIRDPQSLLDAWNFLIDLPAGENLFRAADARSLVLYDKLFRSCNLPSVTQPGDEFVPLWTASETSALKHLLLLGLAEFRARLR